MFCVAWLCFEAFCCLVGNEDRPTTLLWNVVWNSGTLQLQRDADGRSISDIKEAEVPKNGKSIIYSKGEIEILNEKKGKKIVIAI